MAKLFINKDIASDADKMKYWLTGEDSISFSDIQYFMDWMPSDDNRIDVEIHSCGGDCTEGYAIYDALRASGKEISCKVVGTCASMATVILLAAPAEPITAISAVGQANTKSACKWLEHMAMYPPPYALRKITVILGTVASEYAYRILAP